MSSNEKVIVGIDPGLSGGIAWRGIDGKVHAVSMGDTPRDILEQIRTIMDERDIDGSIITFDRFVCYLEDVGRGIPGQSSSATATFARHIGNLEAFLMAEDMPVVKVLPTKWQHSLGIGKAKDCPSKSAWKNKVKGRMQERFPSIKVTLKNADALGILCYAIDKER